MKINHPREIYLNFHPLNNVSRAENWLVIVAAADVQFHMLYYEISQK